MNQINTNKTRYFPCNKKIVAYRCSRLLDKIIIEVKIVSVCFYGPFELLFLFLFFSKDDFLTLAYFSEFMNTQSL